jgi:enhancer of polycomb-like protein
LRRPREKIHRPQTRRRRENNEDSLEKMQAMRRNLRKAGEALEWVTRREQKKAHLAVRRAPPCGLLPITRPCCL